MKKKIKYICPQCGKQIKNYKFGCTCPRCGWKQIPLPR